MRSRQQHVLYDLAETVNRAGALADLYDKALEAITSAVNADRASILLFDEDGVMRFKAWRRMSVRLLIPVLRDNSLMIRTSSGFNRKLTGT